MNIRRYLHNLRDIDMDDALGAVGLQKKSSSDWVFPMLAGLGAGMAIGAGLAFFLTPYRGAEAREKVRKSASEAKEKISNLVRGAEESVGQEGNAGTAAANPPNAPSNRSY